MSNDTWSQKNFSLNPPASSDNVAKPIRVEAVVLDSEWYSMMEDWKYLRDVDLQIQILQNEVNRLGMGVFVKDFFNWLEQKGKLSGGFDDKKEKWHRLKNSEKSIYIAQYLQEKGWIHVFVHRTVTSEEVYITLGYNDIAVPAFDRNSEIDFGHKILLLMFTPLLSREVRDEVIQTLASYSGRLVGWDRFNPVSKIRFMDAIFDMENFTFIKPLSRESPEPRYYFVNYSPLFTTTEKIDGKTLQGILEDIKNDQYDVSMNKFYQFFRNQFDDKEWGYFIDLVGAILKPTNSKLIGYIDGPTDSGKSTILYLLTRPIKRMVATISSISIKQGYVFGLEMLYGKHILVMPERIDKLPAELLNLLLGKRDQILVERKNKPAVMMESLKLAIFAGNGPPKIEYLDPDALDALLNRLSYIRIKPIQGPKIEDIDRLISDIDIMAFLMWCGWNLRQRGWQVRKRGIDEIWEVIQSREETVEKFLESDWVKIDPDARIKGTVLYNAYVKFVRRVLKMTPTSLTNFYNELDEKGAKYGISTYIRDKVNWVRGLRLTEASDVTDKNDQRKTQETIYELDRFSQ
jgi:hypothetical protein